ncbi:MAG: aconitate hydratase [Bacteroidota bacterium]|nr:aconitate hydratase [Bacteroidota bacterium]
MLININTVKSVYKKIDENVDKARELVGQPLTLAEKILYSHLENPVEKAFVRSKDYVDFKLDRVAMQDATAQMALLQFINAGKSKVAVPSSVHCDHLIRAEVGAEKDLPIAKVQNKEVYDFLESVSNKYGIDFWKPGAGIIHQVILENYAFPGSMIIGTDSHTVNAGGMGMVAVGVGGADAVDVMVGLPWELKFPKLIGIKLTGKLNGWTAPKDIILKVAGILTAKGGTGAIIEYFGEGAESISATGKATICNMGAEVGATTSMFAYDEHMASYLKATGREEVAVEANKIARHLKADNEVYANPEKYYDEVLEINLDELEPHLNGPFSPDRAWPISKFAEAVKNNDFPTKVSVGLIGSCTNSSYEDITKAASVARQASDNNIKAKADFFVSPGSELVRYTVERDGLIADLESIGAVVLANACGPCIGQWNRKGAEKQEKNAIIQSFNRNFAKRADGNPNTLAFVASPEIVTAFAISGDMSFNPLTDTLTNENGEEVMLKEPTSIELPVKGFDAEDIGFQAPMKDGSKVEVIISPDSERLQFLTPFEKWNGEDYKGLKLLIKAKGKCTTDHISMAGPWLRFRGHLDNISDNMLIGAVNYFGEGINSVKNQLTGEFGKVPDTARAYKAAGIGSVVVGDENYGEGSSREHAAMEPRNLGIQLVIVRSFARIHETNLKKQGLLGLTFANKEDYDKIQENDTFDLLGLTSFSPDKPLTLVAHHADGTKDEIVANHTYNDSQIEWFKKGSALNLIKELNA